MKTLGVDLASNPKKTGICIVAWREQEAVVEDLRVGADDHDLLWAHQRVDVTGIDAPFGWPVPFEQMLSGAAPRWTGPWSRERRDDLRFRLTDFRVWKITGRWPLSVSADKIAVPALRCAGLLERLGVSDRSGDGRVYEIYPASALHVWGLNSTGYKGPKKRRELQALWIALKQKTPWLQFADKGQESLIMDRDDALDALVAALIARAAKKGLTICPTDDERNRATTEGWIHVPTPGSLEKLL